MVTNINYVLTNIDKGDEMLNFLNALLTSTEKLMLAKRLAIIILLKEGLSDSQISGILHVTRITVAKMQLFYEARGKGFDIALKKLEEQKRLESFKKLLMSLADYTIQSTQGYAKGILKD